MAMLPGHITPIRPPSGHTVHTTGHDPIYGCLQLLACNTVSWHPYQLHVYSSGIHSFAYREYAREVLPIAVIIT